MKSSSGFGIDGVVWIFDGAAWTAHTFEDGFHPFHVWGTGLDVMAVGNGGAKVFDGAAWVTTMPPAGRSHGASTEAPGRTWCRRTLPGSTTSSRWGPDRPS